MTDPEAAIVREWESGKQRLNRIPARMLAEIRREAVRLLREFGRPPSPAEARAITRLVYLEIVGRWAGGVLREVLAGEASVELAGAWRFCVVRRPPQPEGEDCPDPGAAR